MWNTLAEKILNPIIPFWKLIWYLEQQSNHHILYF